MCLLNPGLLEFRKRRLITKLSTSLIGLGLVGWERLRSKLSVIDKKSLV